MDELGYKAEFSKLSNNKPSNTVLNKFYFLSGLWNSMPKKNYENPRIDEFSNFYFNPIIIHLAGIRRRERLKFISKYKYLFIK